MEIDLIFDILYALLNLGNIDFDDKTLGNNTPCEILNIEFLSLFC